MTETTLYERLLGIERPWRVHGVRLALEEGDVEVGVEFVGERLLCPACGAACPGYDRRPRLWRHLDTMQYRTLVRAEVPRMRCREHGVQQVPVPWADAQSRFTALFEVMVIEWLKVASIAAVARRCRLRSRHAGRPRAAPDRRQQQYAYDPSDSGLPGRPSPLSPAFNADQRVVAQCGRNLVRSIGAARPAAWHLHQCDRAARSHPPLHRDGQHARRQTIPMDQVSPHHSPRRGPGQRSAA